ncbi:MAG TPA: TadE/TadG family type IV pilus assembly protein [Variovorax sp.]|nr:TadE/TadG family type IV pilus assembly protein [Variovorax sp.]
MTTRSRQRGVAAVEFAFVLTGLLALFHGIATFGSIFYTQQAIARAAEDGVRAVALMPNGAAPDLQRVRDVVLDSLAGSLVTPADATTPATRRTWLATHVQVAVAASAGRVTVTVSHRYGDNPLMPMTGALPWVPDVLTRQATMARPAA